MEEKAVQLAAFDFILSGNLGRLSDAELAEACNVQIQVCSRTSFEDALNYAQLFIKRAKRRGGILELTAYRTLARILHLSGKHREALSAYLKARKLSEKEPMVRARIDRALIDVYMYLGRLEKTKSHARAALATFARLKALSDLAQTRVNYANVLHRQDRHRDAEKLYREASEFFEQSGNETALARTLYNRGNTLVQLFDLEQAETLYQRSLEIWEKNGFAMDANDSRYGLAWLRMLSGKFHIALLELAECEKVYFDGGDHRGHALCRLDRAEVYLGLGLYDDALDAARSAENFFRSLGLRYERSKAALFRAQAAYAVARTKESRDALARARAGFSLEKNNGFLGAVNLVASDLRSHNERMQNESLRQARQKFSRSQLPLWEAMCDLKEAADPNHMEQALARLKKNSAIAAVPHLFALRETLQGDYESSRGDVAAARHHWQIAADRLDAIRAQLPPVELRSAFGKRQDSPHLRLVSAELDTNPAAAAVWSERYKTAGIWSPIRLSDSNDSSRSKIFDSLESLARQVASISHQIGSVGERGLNASSRSQAITSLQRQIREQLLILDSNQSQFVADNERMLLEMKAVSRRMPIVQLHLREDDIVVFVHQDGETSIGKIKDGRKRLADSMQRWRFILEGELLSGHLNDTMDPDLEQRLWSELGDWLWAPLGIHGDAEKVLLIPEGELSNLPWRALVVDGQTLLERHHFIITPSFRHFLAAERIKADSSRVQVFRGKADDLPEVDRELGNLSAILPRSAEYYSPSRRKDWAESGDFQLWHFSGHAFLRSDNPFYSYLALEDGALFATDFRLKRCQVNLVTLASCRSGEQVALPGEESTGLVRSLLEMGARNIIAGHWPVSDKTTALWMAAFYKSYSEGGNILTAIRHAATIVKAQFPSAYHWAAFSVFGAGE